MTNHIRLLIWLVLAALLSCLAEGESPKSADLVLLHGHIYTVNSAHPWAEALAIRDGRILAVGTNKEIEHYRGPKTHVVDAKGRLVLPGFTDCHVHFLDGSFSLERIDLADAKDLAEIQRRVKAYAASHPHDAWILGRGWSYPLFPPTGLPNK